MDLQKCIRVKEEYDPYLSKINGFYVVSAKMHFQQFLREFNRYLKKNF